MVASICSLKWGEWLHGLLLHGLLVLFLLRRILLLLQFLLQIGKLCPIESSICNTAMLESTAIEPWTVVIVTLTDHLATTNDYTSMAVMEWRPGSLLEAESEIIVGLHFDVSCWF